MSSVIFETAIGDIAGSVHGDKSKPLIIVLHGYGVQGSRRDWNYIYSPLSKLGYLVVGLDMPGFGKSPGKKHKSRSEYMRIPGGPVDVVDEVINLLDKPTAYLLGYDWGAGIAISAAIKLNHESTETRITGLMLFHIAYTQQQPNEIARFIDAEKTKTLILWVDTEQNHPIKLLNNEWKPAFKGCDCEVFECRPYSPDKPKKCYQVISDQVIGAITEWITKYPPKSMQNEEEPVESKQSEQEPNESVAVDTEHVVESEETKEIEVVAQNENIPTEQAQSQQIEQEPEETKVDEPDDNEVNGQSTDPPPSTIEQVDIVEDEKDAENTEVTEPSKTDISAKTAKSTKSKKQKKRKKTMSGIRIRSIFAERIKRPMKADYGELVVIPTRGGKVVTNIVGDAKKGKPYLCFHGWGSQAWARDIQWQFETVSKMGYFVIAPDMPGFGRSDGRRHSSRSETNFDEGGPIEIIEDILKYFGIFGKKINVYGYSWGGGIAVSLALNSSVRKDIDKLVLFHPSYTEQKKRELANIVCKKIILIWVPIDTIHPIALGRYFHEIFPPHEYHEVKFGNFVKQNEDIHEWEKHCDRILPLIKAFLK